MTTQPTQASKERDLACVARDWMDAYVAQDVDRLMSLMTPDARWIHNGSVEISGTYEGAHSIVEDFVKGAYPLFVPNTLRIDVGLVLVVGDTLAMEIVASGIGAATGLEYRSPYAIFMEFRDGRIATAREYVDTAHGAKVLYGDGSLDVRP